MVESSAVGDLIITLTCTDGDSGGNGQITYSIVSGNGDGYFSVTTTGANGINGEIRLATAFDYDAPLATSSFSVSMLVKLIIVHNWYLNHADIIL